MDSISLNLTLFKKKIMVLKSSTNKYNNAIDH
jgi:hypothetical protein